jgi:hypothetical protein
MCRHVSAYGWWFDATWLSQGLPHGTFILVVVIKIFWSPWVRPPDLLHHVKASQHPLNHCTATCSLLYMCVLLFLNSHIFVYGRRSGLGLAPARGFVSKHMTIV